jgi:hypothetical protein
MILVLPELRLVAVALRFAHYRYRLFLLSLSRLVGMYASHPKEALLQKRLGFQEPLLLQIVLPERASQAAANHDHIPIV